MVKCKPAKLERAERKGMDAVDEARALAKNRLRQGACLHTAAPNGVAEKLRPHKLLSPRK
eukprot:6185443-Pleurochrysis_carterae.AAC.2